MSKKFCDWLSLDTIFWFNLAPDFFKLNFFATFSNFNASDTALT